MTQTGNNTVIERLFEKKILQKWWFYALVMLLLVVGVFHQFIFSDKMLFSSDQMGGFDARVLYQTSLLKFHQFPYWFSSRLSGMPTIDALFGDIFYPPSILVSLVASVARAIGFKMLLHVVMAGIFFFLMLRKGFGMHPLVSLTGALFYMLNPQFVSHIYPGHDGKIYVIAWVPFVIWQLKVLLTTPTLLSTALAGLGIGMCILTSHIQLTYFVLWGAGLYWLTVVIPLFFGKKDIRRGLLLSGYFWGAITLGIGLGAMQIFPSVLYIRDGFSVRGEDRGFDFAASWSLHWGEFFSLWVPEFVNSLDYYWGKNPFKLNSEYAGMMPVLLATLAIISKPKNRWRIFWGVVAVGTVLFALGANTPVFHIAYAIIPGVKKFRAASMIMFWFSFSTILLSALFLKDLLSGFYRQFTDDKRDKWSKGILIAGAAAIGVSLLFSIKGVSEGLFSETLADQRKSQIFSVNFSKNFLPFLWVWCIFTVSALALFLGHLKKGVSPLLFTSVILVLGCIDIIRVDSQFIKLVNPKPYFYEDPALAPLIKEMKHDPFRCYSLPGALPRNGEGIHHLEGLGGFHDNELHWYREFRGDQQDHNFISSLIGTNTQGQPYLKAEKLPEGNPFLNLANARYMLLRNGSKLMTVKNRNALNRLSFVPGYVVIDSSQVPDALIASAYDYRLKVAVPRHPDLPDGFTLTQNDSAVSNNIPAEWKTYTTNYRKAVITAPADGFLRIAEVYYPGWHIKIDGKEEQYYRADLAWMTLPITQGQHTVELLPRSHYLAKFLMITVFCALIISISIVYSVLANNRRPQPGKVVTS